MATLVLLSMMNFSGAVGATSSIILLASRDTWTLSILALEFRVSDDHAEASIVAIVLMILTFVVGTALNVFGQRMGVRHQ